MQLVWCYPLNASRVAGAKDRRSALQHALHAHACLIIFTFMCKCLVAPQARSWNADVMEEAASFQADGVCKVEQVQVEGTD